MLISVMTSGYMHCIVIITFRSIRKVLVTACVVDLAVLVNDHCTAIAASILAVLKHSFKIVWSF